jgi:hypothetical protein
LPEPGLQLDRAFRIGQPIFHDLAEGFNHLGDLVSGSVGFTALFAGLEIGGERPPAFLDEARQVARKHFDIDGADLHRLLRWSPHGRFPQTGRPGWWNRSLAVSVPCGRNGLPGRPAQAVFAGAAIGAVLLSSY